MKYKFFDKRFLVFPDEEEHIGDEVFYNDNWDDLIADVERVYKGRVGALVCVE